MLRVVSYISAMLFMALPALAQDTGWIGISIEDQKENGAIISRVQPNSPAEKAGLKEGDIILEFNKESVVGAQQLTRLVRETPVGRTVSVRVRREGREQTFNVTTERASGVRSGRFELSTPNVRIFADGGFATDFPWPQVSTIYVQSGIRVEGLTDQLRDFFGVFSNTGVLVASVDSGSAAAKAGLKAGDVITSVNGTTVRTPFDFSREMRAAGSKPMLKIFRDKKEQEIKIE
jgi:serine protease Do